MSYIDQSIGRRIPAFTTKHCIGVHACICFLPSQDGFTNGVSKLSQIYGFDSIRDFISEIKTCGDFEHIDCPFSSPIQWVTRPADVFRKLKQRVESSQRERTT